MHRDEAGDAPGVLTQNRHALEQLIPRGSRVSTDAFVGGSRRVACRSGSRSFCCPLFPAPLALR